MKRRTRGRSPLTPSEVPVGNKRWLAVSEGSNMKTTDGKTVTRRPARKVQIWRKTAGHPDYWVQDRWASSLSQALREFAKDRWGKGHYDVIGNVLTHGGQLYIAKEKP